MFTTWYGLCVTFMMFYNCDRRMLHIIAIGVCHIRWLYSKLHSKSNEHSKWTGHRTLRTKYWSSCESNVAVVAHINQNGSFSYEWMRSRGVVAGKLKVTHQRETRDRSNMTVKLPTHASTRPIFRHHQICSEMASTSSPYRREVVVGGAALFRNGASASPNFDHRKMIPHTKHFAFFRTPYLRAAKRTSLSTSG